MSAPNLTGPDAKALDAEIRLNPDTCAWARLPNSHVIHAFRSWMRFNTICAYKLMDKELSHLTNLEYIQDGEQRGMKFSYTFCGACADRWRASL